MRKESSDKARAMMKPLFFSPEVKICWKIFQATMVGGGGVANFQTGCRFIGK